MLSVSLIRASRKTDIRSLCKTAGIQRQTYYNLASGYFNVTDRVYNKVDLALGTGGSIRFFHMLDRLYRLGGRLDREAMIFPANTPRDLANLVLEKHPIFQDTPPLLKSASKNNGRAAVMQEI